MHSNQKNWFFGVLENAPAIAFLGLLQSTGDLRLAGWTAVCTVLATLGVFWKYRVAPDTILLGINAYFLTITPLIEGVYLIGAGDLAGFLRDNAQTGVILAIFVVGAGLTVFYPRHFIGVEGCDVKPSLILLLCAMGGFGWSIAFSGDRLLAIVLPIAALFSIRHFLRARMFDKGKTHTIAPIVVAGAPAADMETIV